MKITWHGHAFIEIRVAGKQILIDPFITGNPFTKTKPEDFNPDYILLTHSLMFGREASGFNHWRNSPRLVKVDSRRLLS